jgi:hypothetical protein
VVEDTLPVPGLKPADLRPILKDCTAPVRFRRTNSCGHDLEMKCCDAFKALQGKLTPAPCAVRVLKTLSCGHEVAVNCADEVVTVTCQESSEKPCWNFATCGAKVKVPCKVAAGTVQCSSECEWRCPEGHSFSLRLCSRGIPSDCPSCSTASLDASIRATQRILSDHKLSLWSPESARVLPDIVGVAHITMSLASERDFVCRKLKLLQRFKDGQKLDAQWSNTLFSPMELPVFAVLSRKMQQAQHIDKFDMLGFGSQETLNGIEVFEATQENLDRVVSGRGSIVFGRLYTLKNLKNPVDLPKKKESRSGSG